MEIIRFLLKYTARLAFFFGFKKEHTLSICVCSSRAIAESCDSEGGGRGVNTVLVNYLEGVNNVIMDHVFGL